MYINERAIFAYDDEFNQLVKYNDTYVLDNDLEDGFLEPNHIICLTVYQFTYSSITTV